MTGGYPGLRGAVRSEGTLRSGRPPDRTQRVGRDWLPSRRCRALIGDEPEPEPSSDTIVRPLKNNNSSGNLFSEVTFDGNPSGISYDGEVLLLGADGEFLGSADVTIVGE